MTEIIHKLNIISEAAFDLRECLGLDIDRRALKSEVEEYITLSAASYRRRGYFRCDYIDESSGRMLKLFVYKGLRLGPMQCWDLAGVCVAESWSQEAEDDGRVRVWLETKIEDLPGAEDWVVRWRTNQIIKETGKTLFENVLEEVLNEFECKRDKETAKELAFLQSIHFECGRKQSDKKVKRNRKLRLKT